MKRIFFEGITTFAAFFVCWIILNQVEWINVLKIEKIGKNTEEKLGEIYWEFFKQTSIEITDQQVIKSIESVVTRICTYNKIDKDKIKVHVLKMDEINAFALPDNHLIIFTGLISECENEAEFAGVISHEIAHLELNHVMKQLIKETGLSLLLSGTNDKMKSSKVVQETVKKLSSTAYGRKWEKEADLKAADYMLQSGYNPKSLAELFQRFSYYQPKENRQLTWISTHASSEERAKYILDYCADKTSNNEIDFSEESWTHLKEILKD